jgi:hypothetical protein
MYVDTLGELVLFPFFGLKGGEIPVRLFVRTKLGSVAMAALILWATYVR